MTTLAIQCYENQHGQVSWRGVRTEDGDGFNEFLAKDVASRLSYEQVAHLGKSGSRIARIVGRAAVASTAIFLPWRAWRLGVRLIRLINFGKEWMETGIHGIINDWIDENC